VALTTPLSETFVADRLGHAEINLRTKFEVPTFTLNGNIKCVAKCRKWGGLGSHGVVRGHPSLSAMSLLDRAQTTSYSSLIETIRLSCSGCETFDRSKIATF